MTVCADLAIRMRAGWPQALALAERLVEPHRRLEAERHRQRALAVAAARHDRRLPAAMGNVLPGCRCWGIENGHGHTIRRAYASLDA
jgi:hypothetical protein